jgi:hypothetical protein
MKVLIIHDNDFSKAQILEDMHEEGFLHEFLFVEDALDLVDAIREADEVWTFGEARNFVEAVTARQMRKDVWEMG